jgi:hypothetical protein
MRVMRRVPADLRAAVMAEARLTQAKRRTDTEYRMVSWEPSAHKIWCAGCRSQLTNYVSWNR